MNGPAPIPAPIPTLVEQVRRRLWLETTLRLLGRGLYAVAALTALAALCGPWLGTRLDLAGSGPLGVAWPAWFALLPGALVLTAAGIAAARRRPGAAAAARVADREAGADELLITAWEIAVRGGAQSGAERLLLTRALSARGAWETRVRTHRPGPGPVALLPPLLLLAATLPVLALSAARGQERPGAPAGTAAPANAPGARLAAAIAQLDLKPERHRQPRDAPAGTAAPAVRADPPPPRPDSAQGSEQGSARGLPPATNGADPRPAPDSDAPPAATAHPPAAADQDGQGRTASGSAGAGTQARPPLPDAHRRAGAQTSPSTLAMPGTQPLARTGTPLANLTGPGADLAAGAGPATLAAGPVHTPPAAPPAPRWDPQLGAARRALLARYWTRLQALAEP